MSELITYAIPFIAALIAFFLGRYLAIKITVPQLIPIITAIVEASFHTEVETKNAPFPPFISDYDTFRSMIAAEKIQLPQKEKKTLNKIFGSSLKAVKFVFPFIKPVISLLKK